MRQQNTDLTYSPSALRRALPVATVVHAIPGRIRFRVPVLKVAPGAAGFLEARLKSQRGIAGVNVNYRSHSITVTCDPTLWSPDALCGFLDPLRFEELEVDKSFFEDRRTDNAGRVFRSICWIAGGCASLIVGVVLLMLPIAPGGIPFLVLSIYCFAKAAVSLCRDRNAS